MDKLIRITKNITFEDLRSGKKLPIDIYEEQINYWLLKPLKQLAENKSNFENGYAILALELLFFEPHGKYLLGNSIQQSSKNFKFGFNSFLEFLDQQNLINKTTLQKIKSVNFYAISRCGIYHDMMIKSGLLIDSIHMQSIEVFYESPINNGILVSPWNFLDALKTYFIQYIENIRTDATTIKSINFTTTFNTLFQY